MSIPTIPAPYTLPPPAAGPAPTGATVWGVCARCSDPYEITKWRPPHNHLCPTCITGAAKAVEHDVSPPMLGLFTSANAWGAGS